MVSSMRQPRQGNIEAQAAVSDVIDDLAPQCVLIVGIGGASPYSDAVLGDVIFGTYAHDLTVSLDNPDGSKEFSGAGGPMDEGIVDAVTHLRPTLETSVEIGGVPPIDLDALEFTTEDAALNRAIEKKLRERFTAKYSARLFSGPILSSDRLVKDPTLAQQWCGTRRDALGIDMEFAGAYRASRRGGRSCALLAIRGVSDIVGHKKGESWVLHACNVAAEFSREFVMRWTP